MESTDLCAQCLLNKLRCPSCESARKAAYRRTDAYRMRNAAQKRLDRSRWAPERKQSSLQRLLDCKSRGA
jgi:hypothetical protein